MNQVGSILETFSFILTNHVGEPRQEAAWKHLETLNFMLIKWVSPIIKQHGEVFAYMCNFTEPRGAELRMMLIGY